MLQVMFITHEYQQALGSTRSLVNMLHSIRNEVEPIVIFPAHGKAYEYVRESGYCCYVVPFKLNIASSRLRGIKYVPRLIYDTVCNEIAMTQMATIAKKHHIKIIHSNSSVFDVGYKLSKRTGLKHVWHLREYQNLDFGMSPFRGWKRLKKMIADSDAVIGITDAILNHFVNIRDDKFYVVHDAVRSIEDVSISEKENYLLFCNKVTEGKGAPLAIEVFNRYHEIDKESKLLFLGEVDKDYKKYLLQRAVQYGIEEYIVFLGYRKNVDNIMKKAKALLMCSRSEALGRVTVEAMFYGTPVLGYKSGGTEKIIEHNKNGFLFKKAEEAAYMICELYKNKELLNNIVYNAHTTAKNEFSEEVFASKLLSIYNNIADV